LQELVVFRSLCPTVSDRQNSVEALSSESEVVLVVGDAKSSNTLSLYNKSISVNPHTYLMESNHPYQLNSKLMAEIKLSHQVGFLSGEGESHFQTYPDWQ